MRLAIVGAGFGGIATAVKLTQAGLGDFTVFEQSGGAGGVWYDNTYPGCGVDTASIAYSFSFIDHEWPGTHGTQAQLRGYTEKIIDHFHMRDRFRFNTKVEKAIWDEDRHQYALSLSTGEEHYFDVLVSAVGMLNVPRYPDWPGLDSFDGPMVHTARWNHDLDINGKRVAVVGTGCTSAQLVPEIASKVGHLYVYQREPGWVLPKDEAEYSSEELAAFRKRRVRRRLQRYRAILEVARYISSFRVGSRRHKELTQVCLQHIESSIDDPELRRLVTPDYYFGCKRAIRSNTFYPSLTRPNVELVPKAVTRVTPRGLVDADGVEREVDVVVLAVGFRAADYLASLPIVGRGGATAFEIWKGDPKAYLGLSVPGLPNFLMIYGPNTNGGGPITAQQERQAEAVVAVVRRMQRRGFTVVDTKEKSLERFVRWIDRQNERRWSAINAGCHNYYLASSGRNVTQWPVSHIVYMLMTRVGIRTGMVYR